MKNAIIIYRVDKSNPANAGVIQKLQGQAEGLESCNYKVDYLTHDKKNIYLNQTSIHKFSRFQQSKIKKLFFYNYIRALISYDLYIIRHTVSTPAFLSWLKRIKSTNHKAKILIDMPTYPYQLEWRGWLGKNVLWMDRNYNQDLHKYVELILHSGPEKSIFAIPTFHMSNGITDSQIVEPLRQSKNAKLTMVAIAKWQEWHGLDRLLQGLSKYQSDYKLHIIGEGPANTSLKSLSVKLGIEEQLVWHGNLVGAALMNICRKADIGIGTLGLHRKNVPVDSSLKHRTYCAMGLPFVLAGDDVDFSRLSICVSTDDRLRKNPLTLDHENAKPNSPY